MKPETILFLEKSHELLERADTMMGVGLTDDAGRAAYLAGLHAAQAFIFETTERIFKRHSGVQREFSWLVKDDQRVDTGLRTFLSRTYQRKAIADYLPGSGSHVAAETAREAIQTAPRLIETVAGMLPPNDPAPRAADAPKPDG